MENTLNPNNIPILLNMSKKMTSIFGSTYACKQLFSTMKLAKTKLVVAQPTNEHLQDVMLLSSSTYHLNFKNFQIKYHMKCRINVFLLVSINVCCIFCCRYELLKSAVTLIKNSKFASFNNSTVNGKFMRPAETLQILVLARS